MKDYVKVTNPIVTITMVGRIDDEITLVNQRATQSYNAAKTTLRRVGGLFVIWKFVDGSLYVHKEYVRAYELTYELN